MRLYKLTTNTSVLKTQFANIGIYHIDDKNVILIDTGHIHEAAKVCEYIKENKYIPVAIVNTHGHIDHMGANSLLQQIYSCEIAIPYVDHLYCEDISRYYMSFSTSVIEGLRVYGESTFNINQHIAENQDKLLIKDKIFEIISLKGHTYNQKGVVTPDGVCFLGDSLIHLDVIGKAKFPVVTNVGWHFESMNKIRTLDYKYYVLGHGDAILDKIVLDEFIDKNFDYFKSKIEEVDDILKKVDTFDSIMYELNRKYNIRKNVFKYFVAERTIRSILSYLESINKIKITIDNGVMTYKASR